MQTIIVLIIVTAAAVYVGFYIYRKIMRRRNCGRNQENGGCEDCDLCQDVNTCKIKELKKQIREHQNLHK